jgi:membrane protein YqaA with SNARE-associated domain
MVEIGGLFLAALLSATLLPGSSEALLILLVGTGEHAAGTLLLAATAGNVLGSLVNWVLGRFIERFRDRRWFPVGARDLERAQAWFSRYGLWSLLLAWLPVIGDPLTMIAGVLRVPLLPFLVLVTIGKAARYFVIIQATGVLTG